MRHLDKEQILQIHTRVLEPSEPSGFDNDRLESVIWAIQGGIGIASFHETVPEAAAAYLYYFARGHVFSQGNKRTATVTCGVFLERNEAPLKSEVNPSFVVLIATGDVNKLDTKSYLEDLISSRDL